MIGITLNGDYALPLHSKPLKSLQEVLQEAGLSGNESGIEIRTPPEPVANAGERRPHPEPTSMASPANGKLNPTKRKAKYHHRLPHLAKKQSQLLRKHPLRHRRRLQLNPSPS